MQGYSIRQISAMLGIARSSFYAMLAVGKAPRVTKIGARSIVFERDYLAWLDW